MQKNIALNQDLIDRIFVKQMMLVADEHEDLEPEIYSSWPLFEHGKRIHPKHHGKRMDTLGAEAITLDHAAQQMRLEKVDFIKIDVDGHEYSVLSGGKELLKRFSPVIVMEMAPYVFVKSDHFNDLIYLIKDWDYKIIDADTQIELPADPEQLRLIIPDGSSRNVLLKHR
jgi:FkbM family methyltransferase